jgi:hypothetical protein
LNRLVPSGDGKIGRSVLSEFLVLNRQTIIANSRVKVASRTTPHATSLQMETGVPLFLDQLVATLAAEFSNGEDPSDDQIGRSAAEHGKALHEIGFTAGQVIHDYGDICQAITELAAESNTPIAAHEFRTLNRCLDEAMAEAIAAFGRQRELELADAESKRRSVLAHDLRNLLNVSMLAFDGIRDGTIGMGGSTGALLGVGLKRMHEIIERSVEERVSPKTPAEGS